MDIKATVKGKKRKGGAEKIRIKKQKKLEANAEKCRKLTELFGCSSRNENLPGPSETQIYREKPAQNYAVLDEKNIEEAERKDNILNDEEKAAKGEIDGNKQIEETEHTDIIEHEDEEVCKLAIINKIESTNELSGFNYFVKPKKNDLDIFFAYHPNQDIIDPVLQRTVNRRDGSNRKWLTYCQDKNSLFCSVCLAFSNDINPFVYGMTNKRHIHQRIEEHEKSLKHTSCAEAYFLRTSSLNINNLMFNNQMSLRREQVRRRRQVLQRVVDIVKLIGKRGLSYRGNKLEAAYSLDDISVDHGNFLEFILLLSKYDVCMKEHVTECIEKSKTLKSSGGKGRGSLVTFLSKTTVNKVIEVIRRLIQETIVKEIKAAGMFSVQIDTTQDITTKDQCSVIVRYVTDRIHEKLLTLVKCESSTGEYMFKLLTDIFKSYKIDITRCVGSSTDGAANMQGQYKGFSTWLSTEAPNQVHVWCYAHILNLVLSDTTKVVIASASLFSLINDIAVFIKDSYQRMNIWENVNRDIHHRRLTTIGETRWWSKDAALSKIFGSFSNPESAMYIELIITLTIIQDNSKVKPEARVKAKTYTEALLKYETILTAQIFLRIFSLTSPLSKYLQTSGLDILKAFQMVSETQEVLKRYVRDFDAVKEAADNFVIWANSKLQDIEEFEIEVQTSLPEKRIRKKKIMPGEFAQDEVISDVFTAYKIHIHNVILDTIRGSIQNRFLAGKKLYDDFACLDPRNFSDIRLQGLPSKALEELSVRLVKFDERATPENLRCELENLALHWEKLKTSVLEDYTIEIETPESEQEENQKEYEDTDFISKSCSACKNCAICCYQILRRYNLLTDAYNIIGLGYKFLMTLSFTQVACERSFSTLKFIKNRLRSTVSQDHLESFMLMATEKDILMHLDSDEIIDKTAESSELLQRLLIA